MSLRGRICSEDGLRPQIELLLRYSELVGRYACGWPLAPETHDAGGKVGTAVRRDVGAGAGRVVESFDDVAPIVAHQTVVERGGGSGGGGRG